MITHKRLLEVLKYDEYTGLFTWNKLISKKTIIGSVAGSLTNGYILIGIDNKSYRAHRLAWFYKYKKWPKFIDHKDTIKTHNWIDNLRIATKSQNEMNTPNRNNNSSGYRGVSYIKRSDKWHVRLMVNNKLYLLGNYSNKEDAIKVSLDFIDKHHGHFKYEESE